MKFAILLPTCNRGWLLPGAIDSVVAQTYREWSLYIVNDGSTDNTDGAVAPYLSDPRIHYIRMDRNRGRLHALNVALDRIALDGADWFTEMDDDDRLLDRCLELARTEIRRYPDHGLIIFSTVHPDGTPITRMKATGPRNYLWDRLLSRKVVLDAHEFGLVCLLGDQRFYAPARTDMMRIFWGEFSLRAGSVFCNRPTKMKVYLYDGITRTQRHGNRRKRTEGRLIRAKLRAHVWRSVVRRYRHAFLIYCVYVKLLWHVARWRLTLWLLPRDR